MKDERNYYQPAGFKPIFYKDEPIAWAIVPDDDSRIILIGCDRKCIDTLLSMPGEERITFNDREASLESLRRVFRGRLLDCYKTHEHYTRGEVETVRNWAR